MKYRVGDSVKNKETGGIDVVKSFSGMKEYDDIDYGSASEGFCLENEGWEFMDAWEFVKPADNPEVGDKVKGFKPNINSEKYDGKTGVITDVDKESYLTYFVEFDFNGMEVWCEEVELINKKTLYNLEVGDVVEDSDGDRKTVLRKVDAYIMSLTHDQKKEDEMWTPKELEMCSYKPFTKKEDTIEIEGKKYRKEDVIDRVKKLKEIK